MRGLDAERLKSIRHWAMELVVVVTGVLLALWAQEWAQDRERRDRTEAAMESIRSEARENLSLLMFKRSLDQCLVDREIEIRDALNAPGRLWRPITESNLVEKQIEILKAQPIIGVLSRQGDPMQTSAYRSALATGALTALDREKFEALAQLYANFDQINVEEEKGDQSIRTLAALGQPITLTPEIRALMLGELYSADRSRFAIRYALNNGLADIMRRIGWNDERWFDEQIAASEREQKANGINWKPCKEEVANPFRFKGF